MYWKTIHMLLKNDRSTNELPPLHDPFNSFNLAYDATQCFEQIFLLDYQVERR